MVSIEKKYICSILMRNIITQMKIMHLWIDSQV